MAEAGRERERERAKSTFSSSRGGCEREGRFLGVACGARVVRLIGLN